MTGEADTGAVTGADTTTADTSSTTYGGFATVEELVSAYEATKSADPGTNKDRTIPAKTASADDATPGGEEDKTTAEEVSDALKSAGLDQTKYTEEFAETGELTEDSFKELEKAGFGRAMVSTYIQGLKAEQLAFETTVMAPAGGKEGYGKLLEWASKNMPADEVEAFNASITSGDAARAKLAVAGLAASAKTGARPSLLHGKTGTSDGVKPFASRAESQAAIRDPRYRTDPAYRNEIAARQRISSIY